ncbi:hypothetical protein D3C71_1685390 [compost metagenome]
MKTLLHLILRNDNYKVYLVFHYRSEYKHSVRQFYFQLISQPAECIHASHVNLCGQKLRRTNCNHLACKLAGFNRAQLALQGFVLTAEFFKLCI